MRQYLIAVLLCFTICAGLDGAWICAGETSQPAVTAPDVKKIVLYKHGMGYFERHGKVTGNATVSLPFKTEQMKDLLASFFVLDLNGGKINAVLYDTRDPLSKQIEGILINVPENNALSQFLVQLKGARLIVSAAGEKISGRILGVEPVTEQSNDGRTLRQQYKLVLLTDSGAIRSVDLYSITEFSLLDAALQRDLERLLAITLDAKYTDRKTVTIQARGDGERELRIGYLIEQPIWKASYRILLNADVKADALLQGWALTENNTEDDWKDVDLSFVAGNPLSYIMDLYSPYYPQRPTVPIPAMTGLAVNWGAAPEATAVGGFQKTAGLPGDNNAKYMAMDTKNRPSSRRKSAEMDTAALYAPSEIEVAAKPTAELAGQSMAVMATGTKVGELFSYHAGEKVSIPRGKAAMVPIISQKVKGERVVYYKGVFSPKPVDAYVLKNDTDLTLEAGAITFFEESTSLGSGILSHVLIPGAKEILPFALDTAVTLTPELQSNRQPEYRGILANGYLTLTSVETMTNTWRIANKGKEEKTVIFDQPMNNEFKLTEPARAEDEVEGHYRFRVTVKAAESKEFKVIERRDVEQTFFLTNLSEDKILFYAQQQYFSDKARAFFRELADLQAQKADVVRQIRNVQGQTQRLTEEQNRLRQNLTALRESPSEENIRAKWVKNLADTEEKLVALREQLDNFNIKQRTLEEQLNKKVLEYQGQ